MTGSKDHPYIVVKPFPAGQRQADLYKTSMPDTTTLGRPYEAARDFDAALSKSDEHVRVLSDAGNSEACLRVWDASNEGEFRVGHWVAISRRRLPMPGDFVFARVSDRPVLGTLSESRVDGRLVRMIETANPRWANETLGDDDEIIATVTEHTRSF